MLWTRATDVTANPNRRAFSSPPWGPLPVTTVPVTMASPTRPQATSTWRRIGSGDGRPVGTGRLRGAVVEHDGVGEDQDRQDEVGLDGDGVQVGEDRDAAEHDLADHAADEAERQPRQVPPPGLADEGAEHGQDHRDRDDAREEAVHLLDRAVGARDVDEAAPVALGPVRAAQTGAGEAHERAGHDDHGEGQRGQQGQAAVRRRAEPPAAGLHAVVRLLRPLDHGRRG